MEVTTEPLTPCGFSDKNISDGFFTSVKPALFISKTPISLVEPNLFFTARKIRYIENLSPSKYNTVSTICSKTRGPASVPSLVTCPIIKIEVPVVLANCVSIPEHSLTWLTNIVTGLKLTDMETCYKAFRAEVIQSIQLKENEFGFEPEVTVKIAKKGISIIEVPISYNARGRHAGKKIGLKDGIHAIWCLLKYQYIDHIK